MALLQKLKSLLGFGGSDSERRRSREVGVTVERDGTADDQNETTADATRDRTEDVRAEPPQSATAGTTDEAPAQTADADTSTESAVDSETAAEAETADETDTDLETDAEPVVDAEPEPESTVEPELDDESELDDEPEPAIEAEASEPVTEIKGIGPAYADRLAGAGVETVAELAVSDAAELAGQTDISEKRIQGWIDRAEVR